MLTGLYLHNLGLVDRLDIDLQPGLTVISGETGAGKSMMISGLGIALGDRPRQLQSDDCQIRATFTTNPRISAWLAAHDYGTEEQQDELHIRRVIHNRRNKFFINGIPTTAAELQQLGDLLVSLHSQHQHHALLQRSCQRELLDSHAGALELAQQVAACHQQVKALTRAIHESASLQPIARRELELARYQLAELEALDPRQDEYQQLDQAHRKASVSQQQQQLLAQLDHELGGDDHHPGSCDRVYAIAQQLRSLKLAESDNLAAALEHACELLREAANEASHQRTMPDVQDFAALEARLSSYYQLARKHHCQPEALYAQRDQLHQQVEQLNASLADPQQLQQQLDQANAQLLDAASQLSARRHRAAAQLTTRINQLLPQLAMPDATFSIALTRLANPGAEGLEQPEFLLKTSKDGVLKPLGQIASGGELSRCSLATCLACTSGMDSMTMVFDEVDAGLSGGVATTVGKILRQLATRHQVLCITHQPQIVALADTHLLVEKASHDTRTRVTVTTLDQSASINEIARMLTGETGDGTINASSVQLAQEMYQQGRQ